MTNKKKKDEEEKRKHAEFKRNLWKKAVELGVTSKEDADGKDEDTV